jgi:sigma-B regulation protein RsbU (phosphoserine phosphatase)
VGNLVGGNNTRLILVNEIKALNARLTLQLEEVARVQRSLLPRSLPEIPGLEIATSYLTSDQAGGDYYDFFRFEGGTWGLLIADVAGHGPAAATVMAMLHAILHCYAGPDRSPEGVLAFANARLVEAGIEGNFVTAFFAVFDPRSGGLRFARAGHNPPILKDGATGAVRFLDGEGGLPLGVMDKLALRSASVRLAPMDTLVLYTDGITEAMGPGKEMFGPHRLDEALTLCTGQPDCVVDSVHAALYRHTGSRTRADDQTLVALHFHGPRP